MAKTRHRTFEMFDFLQEATSALASKSARPAADTGDAESWSLRCLTAARRPSGVVHISFQQRSVAGAETENDFAQDLADLAELLDNGSRVLLDFEELQQFSSDSIGKLTEFDSNLKAKGSRVVLCNLEPTVQAAFFPNRNPTSST